MLSIKKSIFYFLMVLIEINLNAQNRTDTIYYKGSVSNKKIYQIIQVKGKHLFITEFNNQGKKTNEYRTLNGLKEGQHLIFNLIGGLIQKTNYKKGLKWGMETIYFNSGNKKSEISYINNYKRGAFTIWNESGKTKTKGSYDTVLKENRNKNLVIEEVLDGNYKNYLENGKLEKTCFYKKGKLNKRSKEWYANGNKKMFANFKDGRVYGLQMQWYENGQIRSSGKIYNSIEINNKYIPPTYNGKQLKYFENGKLESVQNYKNSLPDGDWIWYNENGSLSNQRTYYKGQLQNTIRLYDGEGNLQETTPYQTFNINGRDTALVHGKKMMYNKNGNVYYEQNFYKGFPYGISNSFYENGKLERQIFMFGSNDRYAVLKEFAPNGNLLKAGTFCLDPQDSTKFKTIVYATYTPNAKITYKLNHLNCAAIGSALAYYPNGNLMMEAFVFQRRNQDYTVIDESGTSWQTFYYPNGALWYEVFKVDNFKHGEYVEWFPDGSLKRFINPTGLDVQWMQDGSLMASIVYNTNNNQYTDTILVADYVLQLYSNLTASKQSHLKILQAVDGLQQSYYTPQKKRFETIIKNGSFDKYFIAYTYTGDTLAYIQLNESLMDGNYLVKNVNNTLFMQGFFTKGKAYGTWKMHHRNGLPDTYFEYDNLAMGYKPYHYEYTFHQNGAPKERVNYVMGKRNGWCLTLHPNGQIADSSFFHLDTLEGRNAHYTDEGKPYSIENYKNGKKQGLQQQWYYKDYGSKLMREEYFVNNTRQGKASYYYPNGKLSLTAYYQNGIEDSLWIYYDSLGNENRSVLYKMGIKTETPVDGKCACSDKQPKKQYAQSLKGLIDDDVDLSLWQLPFHENIENIVENCFFRNLQTDNNRNEVYYGFDLIALQQLKIGIPNKNGMQLILNPCWRKGEESEIEVSLNVSSKKPNQTIFSMEAPRMAFVLPQRIFTNTKKANEPSLAHFKLSRIEVNADELNFENVKPICVDEVFLLSPNYKLNIDTFTLSNLYTTPEGDLLDNSVSLFYSLGIPKAKMVSLKQNPPLIKEGSGQLQIKVKDQIIITKANNIWVGSNWTIGTISIPNVLVKKAKLYVNTAESEVLFTEFALYQQMKLDGFTQVIGNYYPETKSLEIGFYIYKK